VQSFLCRAIVNLSQQPDRLRQAQLKLLFSALVRSLRSLLMETTDRRGNSSNSLGCQSLSAFVVAHANTAR
jgi:hypothetical protein